MTGPARDITREQAAHDMAHHAPNNEDRVRGHELARTTVFAATALLLEFVPPGRDKSLMYTHLEDALMRANKALAVNGGPKDGADLEALSKSLNAALGDWATLFWEKLGDLGPDDDDLTERAEAAAQGGVRTERWQELQRRALESYHVTRASGVSTDDAFAVNAAVQTLMHELGATKAAEATSAEQAAQAFHSLLVEGTATGTMVPTAINQPWDQVEGAWRNTLVAVFSDLYGQGTIR